MKKKELTLEEVSTMFNIEGINLPTEKELLTIKSSVTPTGEDIWMHKGKELPKAQVSVLKAQAETFAESKLWEILKDEILWQAQQRGLVKATGIADIVMGKSLIFLTDVLDTKLKKMR
jgi:hypothetical protein